MNVRKYLYLVSILVATLSCLQHLHASTGPAEIQRAAAQRLAELLGQQGLASNDRQRVDVAITPPDARLQLADCDIPLKVMIKDRKYTGRLSAKVSCQGNKPWAIYVSAQVKVYKQVVVSSASLARNQILSAAQLRLAERDVSLMTQGYFTSKDEVAGRQLKRAVSFNGVITANMLTQPIAVKKGDEVLIEASSGSISVQSPGIALSNGRIGQQIPVRNKSSRRTVKARVIEKGRVAVTI